MIQFFFHGLVFVDRLSPIRPEQLVLDTNMSPDIGDAFGDEAMPVSQIGQRVPRKPAVHREENAGLAAIAEDRKISSSRIRRNRASRFTVSRRCLHTDIRRSTREEKRS